MFKIYNKKKIFCFLLCTTTIFSQVPQSVKIDTSKVVTAPKLDKLTNDTLKTFVSPSREVTLPMKNGGNIKILLAKEAEGIDWINIILPIITLFFGFFLTMWYDKFKDKAKYKTTGERYVLEIGITKDPIKKQIQALEKFGETIKNEDDFNFPSLNIYPAIIGDVFIGLDKNELFRYIELNHKKLLSANLWELDKAKRLENRRKEYQNILNISNRTNGFVTILSHQYKMIEEKWQSYLDGTSKYTQQLTTNLQDFRSVLQDFTLQIEAEGVNIETDPRYKRIYELYMEQIVPNMQDGKYNPFVLGRDFFKPLNDVLVPLREDIRLRPMMSAVSAAVNSIAGFKMERKYMQENVQTIVVRYKELLSDIEPLVNDIQNLKN